MAKRNTRGRPRKERDLESRRTYKSKAERDRLRQQRAILFAGVAIFVMVAILGYALFRELYWIPRSAITTVDSVEVKTGDYQKRVRAERWYQANEVRQLTIQSQRFGGQFGDQDPFAQRINILLGELLDTEGFGEQVLEDMELQVLLEAEAERRGIEINEAEIQAQVDDYIQRNTGLSLTPTPTREPTEFSPTTEPLITATPLPPSATPTITPLPTLTDCEEGEDCPTVTPLPTATATSEFTNTPEPSNTPIPQDDVRKTIEGYENDVIYADAEDVADIDREILRDIFYFQALQVALREAIGDERIESGDINTQQLAASTRHILISVPGGEERDPDSFDVALCESEEWSSYRQEAEAALAMLENGEPFALLAQSISDDPGSGANGGLLGEVTNVDTSYVGPFAQAIHEAEIGEYVGPVCTQFGFHIIQVLDKSWEDLSEQELNTARNTAYDAWTGELFAEANIQRESGWEDRIEDEPTLEDLLGDIYSFAGNSQVSSQGGGGQSP